MMTEAGYLSDSRTRTLRPVHVSPEVVRYLKESDEEYALRFGTIHLPLFTIHKSQCSSKDLFTKQIDRPINGVIKADSSSGRDAILRVFLKVFNEKLGYSGDHPHIAELERRLDAQDELESFKAAFHAAADLDWALERDGYSCYMGALVQALSDALGMSAAGAQAWFDKAEDGFKSVLTVENFARWVKEYLDSRDPDHRIIFRVDENGQFIGQDTHLMLNLQTITENLGTACGGRAWVVVTSQEDIDAVLGEVRASKANDFPKIQGRFKTRLSLSSANVDEVIQKRLLSNTAPSRSALADVYREKANILKNQLSFSNVGMT